MHSWLRHYGRRLLRRPISPPAVDGIADAAWYDAAYRAIENYDVPYWQSQYYFLWCVLAERIRAAGIKRVVDIGCGPGQFAACLFGLTEIETYAGLDFSKQAVAMAKRVCPRGHYVVDDATTTTLHQDIPHDLVTCTEVLEHVPADHLVLNRFKPGVRCLCTVPNFPYPSHVRHFKSAAEVLDRYGQFFDRPDVWLLRKSSEDVFFLLDGIRNSYHR